MCERWIKVSVFTGILLCCCLAVAGFSLGKDEGPGVSSSQALKALQDGNARFTAQKMVHPRQSGERVKETAKGQHPVAVVVSCSDSRVPPEVVFDQGVGDLFVVRTAGEVVKDIEIGSIEYAVEHLHAPLIVVLGHKRCGAVEAAVKGGSAPGSIGSLITAIKPAVEEAKKGKGDVVDNAVRINARMVSEAIKKSEIVKHFMKDKGLTIVEAYYDIDDGTVTVAGQGK